MGRPNKQVEVGREYGWLTVLDEEIVHERGKPKRHVRCRCGKEYNVQASFLYTDCPKCRECSWQNDSKKKIRNITGMTIGSWEVYHQTGRDRYGAVRYLCRCTLCGKTAIHTYGEIKGSKANRCENCDPEYHFLFTDDGTAIGTLPDGSEFLIDAEDVERVKVFRWRKTSKGYIKRNDENGEVIWLHRFVLSPDINPDIGIDHINRNRLDCRKDNLRIATQQQNTMNRGMPKNNTSGYKGVHYSNTFHRYIAVIGLNNKSIYLGSSIDPVVCAQMYNCAVELLFGEYLGYLNDVPKPSSALHKKIEDKCQRYLAQSILATTPFKPQKTA